jgi:hypothetical protein
MVGKQLFWKKLQQLSMVLKRNESLQKEIITEMVNTDPGYRGKLAASETVSLFSTPGRGVL